MSEPVAIHLPLEAIRAYCETQPIRRLSVFGSAARNELTPESDVDLLVEYDARCIRWLFFDMGGHLMRQLQDILGRQSGSGHAAKD